MGFQKLGFILKFLRNSFGIEKPRRNDDDDFVSSSMDRISELPEPILHRILCFLSQKQAVQTCLLSKSWRHLWCTRPILVFRQSLFRGNKKTFVSILEQTLQRYHHQNLSIKKIIVDMVKVDDDELILLLEKWIPIVLMSLGVETFHLIFPHTLDVPEYYALPSAPVVFQAEFLTELCLSGFRINSFGDGLCLKHLKTLLLKLVYIEDETLAKIMERCPLIELVDLHRCRGLITVKVSNLKHFACWVSGKTIEIDVPSSLETIEIKSSVNWYLYRSNNHHFPRLKSLYLHDVRLSEEFPDILSSNSPCLEDLVLSSCSGFSQVNILSHSIKRLTIVKTKKEIKTITIDAPGILYFEFSCSCSLPTISFTIVDSSEWRSNISVHAQPVISNFGISMWFLKLNDVVKALRHSRITVNIPSGIKMNRHIEGTNHVSNYEPGVVEYLDLAVFDSPYDFAALFDCLFQIIRPRYIYLRLYTDGMQRLQISRLSEFIWKTNSKDGEFSRCYFWQQQLKELRLEIFDYDSREWRLVRGSRLPVFAWTGVISKKCSALKKLQVENLRVGFEWRESV